MSFGDIKLPPEQVQMFQDLITQMKENNTQTKRIADFLEKNYPPGIAPLPQPKPASGTWPPAKP